MFKRTFYRIRKLFEFLKLGWKDCDWDYYYLYKLERYKLSRMADDIEKYDTFEGSEFVVRDMRLCIKLIDIIIEDDTCTMINKETKQLELTKYVNTKNEKRFGFNTLNSDKVIVNNSLRATMSEKLRQEKAACLYYEIRRNYTFDWWY